MTDQTYSGHHPNHTNRWEDWADLLLAVWLFFSPWILQFGTSGGAGATPVSNAAWNSWVIGVILFLVALSALGRMNLWQEWVSVILGAWVFIAPWVLGFAGHGLPSASWDHWIVGALVVVISGFNVSTINRTEPGEIRR